MLEKKIKKKKNDFVLEFKMNKNLGSVIGGKVIVHVQLIYNCVHNQNYDGDKYIKGRCTEACTRPET